MTLTLKLDPALEQRLRKQAAKRGVAPDSYALLAIQDRLQLDSRGPASLRPAESKLLTQINRGLPESLWDRYDALIARRRAETLTRAELRELIAITNKVEVDHARRTGLLVKLAKLRGVQLEDLMNQLGIKPRPHPGDVDE